MFCKGHPKEENRNVCVIHRFILRLLSKGASCISDKGVEIAKYTTAYLIHIYAIFVFNRLT